MSRCFWKGEAVELAPPARPSRWEAAATGPSLPFSPLASSWAWYTHEADAHKAGFDLQSQCTTVLIEEWTRKTPRSGME